MKILGGMIAHYFLKRSFESRQKSASGDLDGWLVLAFSASGDGLRVGLFVLVLTDSGDGLFVKVVSSSSRMAPVLASGDLDGWLVLAF